MNIKRYIAKDMMEATRKIREELGSEAVILNNKLIRKKGLKRFFSPPMVEVVVAYEPFGSVSRKTPNAGARQDAAGNSPEAEKEQARSQRIRELDSKISNIQAKLEERCSEPEEHRPVFKEIIPSKPEEARAESEAPQPVFREIVPIRTRTFVPAGTAEDAAIEALVRRLTEMDVIEEMARSVAVKANRIAQVRHEDVTEVMKQVICEQLGDPQPIRLKKFQRTVAILFGPTGVGKTTSLIKLAAHYSLEQKVKVGLINTDTYRLAAHEQLKAYADIIGTPLSVVYSADEITQALYEHEDKDIVFIDTTGKKPGDMDHRADIEKMMDLSGAGEVFLVLSAPTSPRACREILDNYNCLKNFKLLITKMDETKSPAAVLNARWMSGRPLSYVATGQNVPDDIQVANVEEIAGRSLEGERACLNRLAN